VLNASPFYYGSMRASYQPLPNFKASTIVAGTVGGFTNTEFIPYSQQPGVWLKPQHSEGAELTLPFFYPRSFLKAQLAQDFTDMGTLRMIIYNVLQSANGVTGQGVTVQVYAWAENVTLAGPSVVLSMQGDGRNGLVSSMTGTLVKPNNLAIPEMARAPISVAVANLPKTGTLRNRPAIEATVLAGPDTTPVPYSSACIDSPTLGPAKVTFSAQA